MWVRPKLENRPNDLNYYREINLVFKDKVYTFTMKTDEDSFGKYSPVLDQILQTFMEVKPSRNQYLLPEIILPEILSCPAKTWR
ncbi:hypothetical protein N752_19490 [Desulforamulus aquiferis]|nr:hypothetical protein [Desulforamulus aquiferis]RYD03593.1 hypothetical protein N752_19490 [Desulforamulus aquiferis]